MIYPPPPPAAVFSAKYCANAFKVMEQFKGTDVIGTIPQYWFPYVLVYTKTFNDNFPSKYCRVCLIAPYIIRWKPASIFICEKYAYILTNNVLKYFP